MFKKRIKLEDRIYNMQYRNRQAVRGAEQQVLNVVGVIFLLMVAAGYIGTWASNFKVIQPAHAQEIVEEVTIQSVNVNPIPIKVGASDFQNEMIEYAYEISGKDFDFIKLIEAESGWRIDAVGVNTNGTKDYGLGQISGYWHPQIVNDPKFNNWKWEIDTVYQLYAGGTKFYGISRINDQELIDNFKWITK